ncbi:MAG: cytochrome ubiquinol oxidase subunit I [Armatimonadota bacterium]
MDAVILARIQFGLTIAFHFLFPPLTIGLSWIIFGMVSRYAKTKTMADRVMARFWIKLFGISFAVGVATGLAMEFQFGTNWANYSRYVGDVFGSLLAAEALTAFFLESTFMAILLLGWDKVSTNVLRLSAFLVAFGSTVSGFWILVANSWQQTPAGYKMNAGRPVLDSFSGAVFNPSMLPRFFHTIDGAIITGSFFVIGISAWYLLKGRNVEFATKSLRTAMVWAVISTLLQPFIGHWHGINTAHNQPVKLAAYEALFETENPASMALIGIPRPNLGKITNAIRVPSVLTWMIYGKPQGEVVGLNDLRTLNGISNPKITKVQDNWPPILMLFFSFRAMVGIGMLMALLVLIGAWLLWKGKIATNKLYLKIALWMMPLPWIANNLGWAVTEMGRQPWTVQNMLLTVDSVSVNVPAWQVLLTVILFVVVYATVFGLWAMTIRKQIEKGPEGGNPA